MFVEIGPVIVPPVRGRSEPPPEPQGEPVLVMRPVESTCTQFCPVNEDIAVFLIVPVMLSPFAPFGVTPGYVPFVMSVSKIIQFKFNGTLQFA
jgi:hypothetical protein